MHRVHNQIYNLIDLFDFDIDRLHMICTRRYIVDFCIYQLHKEDTHFYHLKLMNQLHNMIYNMNYQYCLDTTRLDRICSGLDSFDLDIYRANIQNHYNHSQYRNLLGPRMNMRNHSKDVLYLRFDILHKRDSRIGCCHNLSLLYTAGPSSADDSMQWTHQQVLLQKNNLPEKKEHLYKTRVLLGAGGYSLFFTWLGLLLVSGKKRGGIRGSQLEYR